MHRSKFLAVVLLAFAATTRPLLAGPVSGLTTFVPDTPAKAAEVNGNFTAVQGAVNDNNSRIGALESGKLDTSGGTLTGPLIAPDFAYSAPAAGKVIASPMWCVRSGSGIDPDATSQIWTPPGTTSGPSISTTNTNAMATTSFFCPIYLAIPPGAVLTITDVTMAFVDTSLNCFVSAELRFKPFGADGAGTPIAAGQTGVPETPGVGTQALLLAVGHVVAPDEVLWINASVGFSAASSPDCRYSGVLVSYTVSKP